MADIVSKEKRSRMMRSVRRSRTSIEESVAEILRTLGARSRRNHPSLPGHPDFANVSAGWAIFVHGCFWHGHTYCHKTKSGRKGRVPASNRAFWLTKLEANRERDRRKARQIRKLGIRVRVIWECELSNRERVEGMLRTFLTTGSPP